MLNDNVTPLSPAFEQNNVPVVLAVNNLFAPYAGVFIQSLLDHTSKENNYDIIIFQRDISQENERLLKSLSTGRTNVSIRFYDPSPLFVLFDYEDEKHHYPLEVFYKIIAPHILNYPGRIITVDVDTLLKTDIAQLIDEDLGGCSVGGVCDVGMSGLYLRDHIFAGGNTRVRDYIRNVCGLDDVKNYVNTGLLLFDRDKYVQELDIDTILNTAQQGGYHFPEQDVLNKLMKDRIKALDFKWNVFVRLNPYKTKDLDAGSKLYDGAYERAYEDPYLIHWTPRPKPWVCPDVPWGGEWWQTALRTPFVGHIIARMMDAHDERKIYFRNRYGKEVDVWEPAPKGIDWT